MKVTVKVHNAIRRALKAEEVCPEDGMPVFLAQRVRSGECEVFTFWCPWCHVFHTHSAENGHRLAHCYHERSPLKKTGYILVEGAEGKP